METARAYIDGHNFYHGSMKDSDEIRKAVVWEEKGTDVNLAADLVRDCCDGLRVALVLSNDSDLQRAVDIAIERGTTVYIANPHHRAKAGQQGRRSRRTLPTLRGSDVLNIRRVHLLESQLPDEIEAGRGVLRRPETWAG